MSAREFLDDWIIGQSRIKTEVAILMEEMQSGTNMNLVFQAPSGYGKNLLANVVANFLSLENSIIYLGEQVRDFFDPEFRLQVLDEIHEIREPEFLYPILDSDNHIIILLSNEWDTLKEPLINRCIPVEFSLYSETELGKIVSLTFLRKGVDVGGEFCLEIAKNSRGNPRVAELLAKRLAYVFKRNGTPDSSEELSHILFEFLRIEKGGMTERDRIYLNFLESQRNPTGLDTICFSTGLTKRIIRREIEPFLIGLDLIRITPRGRSLTKWDF